MRLRPPVIALATIALFAACGEAPSQPGAVPTQPEVAQAVGRTANVTQSYASGVTPVTAYDPIFPPIADPTWPTTSCTATPAVGLNAGWLNPHEAVTGFWHPWINDWFAAGWINAWDDRNWQGVPPSKGPGGQSWTKYTAQVQGNGDFVIRLLADNCSWIYLDGTLVGVQNTDLSKNSYGLTLNGTHTLAFIIFDGGGAAGGKFILETTTNPPPALNPDLDGDGHVNTADAFPLNPAEWADTDGDGHGDNGDAFPADAHEWTDTDHDGVGDNSDAFPLDPLRWLLTVPTTTTVSFGAGPFTYTGAAFAASATVSPAGTAVIVYSGDCTNAGSTCAATATFAGDAGHDGSSATASITIAKAPSATTVSFGAGPFVFKGSAFVATAASTAATSLIGGPAIAYTGDCTNGGITCTVTATYGGDANHSGSNATAKITITYAVCASSGGDDDHDGDEHGEHGDDRGSSDSRGVESGSTVPVKLRVCNALGRSIGSRTLAVKAVSVSPTGSLNDSGKANPGYLFRFDDGKYMFNLSTKGFAAGNFTLDYTIGSDPTIYHYAFSVRAEKSKDKDSDKDKDKDKGKDGKKP